MQQQWAAQQRGAMTEAEQWFDTAVGYSTVRRDTESNPAAARQAFKQATELDLDMCDAWMGLAKVGVVTAETIWNIYRCRANLGEQCERAMLPYDALGFLFPTGVLTVSAPAHTAEDVEVALAAVYAYPELFHGHETPDYSEAERVLIHVLEVLGPPLKTSEPNTVQHNILARSRAQAALVLAGIYSTTERWTDVLTLPGRADVTDWGHPMYDAAMRLLIAFAYARLGSSQEAKTRLAELEDYAANNEDPQLVRDLAFVRVPVMEGLGYMERALGNEEAAVEIFTRLYNANPQRLDYRDTASDPEAKLKTVTPEAIESRTDRWDPSTAIDEDDREESEAEAAARAACYARSMDKLDATVGLIDLKADIRRKNASIRRRRGRADRRRNAGHEEPTLIDDNHAMLVGPPGTGKSTVAEVYIESLYGLGVLPTPKLVVANKGKLVADYVGQTAGKTTAVLESARGGGLLIDEAYALSEGGESDFGHEAIATLIDFMERPENRNSLVVMIAGYPDRIQGFLQSNPGLQGRFSKTLEFPSYSADELTEIAGRFAESGGVTLADDAVELLRGVCHTLTSSPYRSSSGETPIDAANNARWIRKVVNDVIDEQALRLDEAGVDPDDPNDESLDRIELADMRNALRRKVREIPGFAPGQLVFPQLN